MFTKPVYIFSILILAIILSLIGKSLATHFPSRAERAIESWGSFGPEFLMEYPGRNDDRICTGEPDNTIFWFNHTSHMYMTCTGGVAVEQEYVMTVDKDLITISKDAWFRNHVAIGNDSAIDTDPFDDSFQPILLNIVERLTSIPNINAFGMNLNLKLDTIPVDAESKFVYPVSIIATTVSGNEQDYAAIFGIFLANEHRGDGDVRVFTGLRSAPAHYGPGLIEFQTGIDAFSAANFGTGTVRDATGVFVNVAQNTGGGTVENIYGVYIDDQSGVASGVDYNLISKGVNSKNLLEGSLEVDGLTDLDGNLDVAGNSALHGTLAIDSTLLVSDTATVKELKYVTPLPKDAVLVADINNVARPIVLPNCLATSFKALSYNQSTQSFACVDTIPTGMIAMRESACPTDWTEVNLTDNVPLSTKNSLGNVNTAGVGVHKVAAMEVSYPTRWFIFCRKN